MFDLARADARGAAFLDGCGLAPLLAAPVGEVLSQPRHLYANRNAQPLIVAAQLAAWDALREELGAPAVVAGYSVGELSACAIAGVFAAREMPAMAAHRARFMDEAAAAAPDQGLMSVGGLAVEAARACLQRHGAFVAIETGDDTLIAGGAGPALGGAATELAALGARVGELPVGLASHTPLMQAAVAPFLRTLSQAGAETPSCTLLAGVSGQAVADGAQAATLLARQLGQTVQWSACMDACAERGVTLALELGPGNALSRMLRERHPQIECRSLADFRSLAGALSWLRRHAG
jgi:[acyl-carrier-protein] S-malonyltransferase